MKILKTKTYKELINKIEHLEKTRDDYYARIVKAEDLKSVLEKFSSLTINGMGWTVSGGSWSTAVELPADVLRYVDDILGGKVIKQEGIKCLVIDKNGDVKTGLTKQAADTKYSYKLVRQ